MSRSSGSSTDSLATSRTKSAASVAEAASIAQGETQTRQNEGSRMARERSPEEEEDELVRTCTKLHM